MQGQTCRMQGRTWILEEKCRGIHTYRTQVGVWSLYISLFLSMFLSRSHALSRRRTLSLSSRRDLALVDPLVPGILIGVRMAEDLIACCRALPRCYHRPCQEKFLQPEHMLSRRVVRDRIDFPRQNLGLVRHPRVVPLVQRVRVVASDSLHCVCVCVCVC